MTSKSKIHSVTDCNCEVTLFQAADLSFSVTYGKQVKTGLSYPEAAQEYGECILHSLACCGKIREASDE